jgi:WD40 repeat protein
MTSTFLGRKRSSNEKDSDIISVCELDCEICKNLFDLGKHLPLTMECGHAICLECYKKLEFKCPYCQQFKKATKFIYLISKLKNYKIRSSSNTPITIVSGMQNKNDIKLKCPNNHDLKSLDKRNCIYCEAKTYNLGCVECNYHICYECETRVIFKKSVCLMNHKLQWSIKKIDCIKCNSIDTRGLTCPHCEYFNQCLACCEYKFSIKTCPNNHKLIWSSQDLKCSRCRSNSKGHFCLQCRYIICFQCYDPRKYYSFTELSLPKTWFAIAGNQYHIEIWDDLSQKCIKQLIGHSNFVTSILKLGEHKIASGSRDSTVKLWDVLSGTCIKTLYNNTSLVTNLISIDEFTLACGSVNNIILWDLSSGIIKEKLIENSGDIHTIVKLNKNFIACASNMVMGFPYRKTTISIWNVSSGKRDKSITEENCDMVFPSLLKLDEITIAKGSNGIKIYDVKSGTCTKTLTGNIHNINTLIMLYGNFIASGGNDNLIKIWDVSSGKLIKELSGHSCPVTTLFKLDKITIASGSKDGKVKIWDVANGRCIKTIDTVQSKIDIGFILKLTI